MNALPPALHREIRAALSAAGRVDLVARLDARRHESMTSGQAARLLGVSSPNTVKNWLEAGHFPGAYKTAGGHWRFLRSEVEAMKARMDDLRERNRRGDLTPPDTDEAALPTPPLL